MIPEPSSRQKNRLDPAPAWSVFTDAPLKGFVLAREAGTIIAWDAHDHLYAFDLRGEPRATARAPAKVIYATASDDGSVVALVGEGARLWILDSELQLVVDRQAPPEPTGLAIDAHGRFIAVASRLGPTHFYSRHGKPAGRFETLQPLAYLLFVPDRPFLVGAATQGLIAGVELSAGSGGSGKLEAEIAWQERLLSNVGRLTTSGDGGMILASCFTFGIQRYDLQGTSDGAYHLGGTTAHAVPDFAGRIIGVATLENEIAVLGSSGNVHWRTELPRPAIALEVDPLGRYLIHGQSSGEIVRLDLFGSDRPAAGVVARAGSAAVRAPEWRTQIAGTDEQAAVAVVAVLDEPPRVGLITNNNKLQIFTVDGKTLGQAPEISGVGRYLRTGPGWIAGATDRQIVLYDARRNAAHRLDMSLVEITHLAVRPDVYGVAIVQERERLGRATLAGRWVWKRTLPTAVEDLAIGNDGSTAVTTQDGRFRVFNPGGEPIGDFAGESGEPLFLVEAPEGSPREVAWVTLARRSQRLHGHDANGRVVWETPVPWEGWQFFRLGSIVLASSTDGHAAAYDGAGRLRAQSRSAGAVDDVFTGTPAGEAQRVSRQGGHLICSDLSGRVKWRYVSEDALGPTAVGRPGTAVIIGRSLAWFGSKDS